MPKNRSVTRAVPLRAMVERCDKLLQTATFTDWDGAVNGLQAQNSGAVTKIAAAVDGSLATVRMAIAEKANLLVVHHGLFWSKAIPWTGKRRELLALLIQHDVAVYSSHLPLDAHRRLGNNALLCAALGFRNLEPFFLTKGRYLGWKTRRKISRDELGHRLTFVLRKEPILLAGGGAQCERIGVVTGGAGAELKLAADEGVDTFITGEGPHWTYALAEDAGINVFYGGHYATETFGVKALAADLSKTFRIPWVFLDHPSGL
jgi:dinuclear metal center YbgI/SA1388 family protein